MKFQSTYTEKLILTESILTHDERKISTTVVLSVLLFVYLNLRNFGINYSSI